MSLGAIYLILIKSSPKNSKDCFSKSSHNNLMIRARKYKFERIELNKCLLIFSRYKIENCKNYKLN